MNLYHVIHTHRHGVSPYLVRANEEPSRERLIEALRIDFEPGLEETLEVFPVDAGEPTDLDGPPPELRPVQTPDSGQPGTGLRTLIENSDRAQVANELRASIEKFNRTLEGDSGDEESDAACEMRNAAAALLRIVSPAGPAAIHMR